MQLKKGDKVKFLNETGGGVISRIEGLLIFVEIEDGFEIPTTSSNLVKVDPTDAASRFFDEDFGFRKPKALVVSPQTDQPIQQKNTDTKEEEESSERVSQKNIQKPTVDSSRFAKGVYLAVIPQDQRVLISGPLNIYLVNHTETDILFNLYLRKPDGRYAGTDFGSVEPDSSLHLFELERKDLNDWNDGILQVLFHQAITPNPLTPVSSEFKIKQPKTMKEDNYTESPWFVERAVLVLAVEIPVSNRPDQSILDELAAKFGQPLTEQKSTIIINKSLIERHQIKKGEAEVDLHISSLTEDYGRMTNYEILKMQKEYFMKTLDSALSENYRRVVYIHGIGNGTLRHTLTEALKEIEGVKFRNAAFAQYGNGAIEVLLGEG
jgi:hypothetical protein